jgi:HD-like signal output (HDOD) protein
VDTQDFKRMNMRAKYFRFSRPIIDMSARQYAKTDLQIYRLWRDVSEEESDHSQRPLLEIRRQIEKLTDLPAMPDMGLRLLQLRANPNASIPDLSRLVEQDPSLSAQVLKLARSAYYGFGGRIVTVEQAVLRVLGFDMVLHMSLGAAIGKSFRVPKEGELGLHAYWRNALYCGMICHALARQMPIAERPNLGLAYLCGLLHDFGFLLLGHLFRQEYYILSKVLSEHPDKTIPEIEKHVLGVGHTQIGAWLMKAWEMPEEIILAVREHHHPDYQGEHVAYVNLVQLALCYLGEFGIGSERPTEGNKDVLLQKLGIDDADACKAIETIIADGIGLDTMARQLAA